MEEMNKLIERYKLQKLKQEEIENFNRPIVSKEMESIIKNTPPKQTNKEKKQGEMASQGSSTRQLKQR